MVRRILSACAYLGVMVAFAATARAQITVKAADPPWPGQAVVPKTAPELTNKMMAVNGNIYIVGQGEVTGANAPHISVWAYSTTGTLLWQANFVSPDYKSSYGVAVAVESNGSAIYVAGAGLSANGHGYDYIVLALSGTGALLWPAPGFAVYNNTAQNGDDIPVAMSVGPNNDLYVTGTSVGMGTGTDIATVNLVRNTGARNGNWFNVGWGTGVRRFDGGAGLADTAADIDTQSYVDMGPPVQTLTAAAITGTTITPTSVGTDLVVLVYLNNGNLAPNSPFIYDGGVGDDAGTSLDFKRLGFDGHEDLFVTGYATRSATQKDYVTFGLDPLHGILLWGPVGFSRPGTPEPSGKDIPYKVVFGIDSTGIHSRVYVTGESNDGSGTGADFGTAAYDANSGQWVWNRRFSRPGVSGGADRALDLATHYTGDVYVAGPSYNGGNFDYVATRYNSETGLDAWLPPAPFVAYNGAYGLSDLAGAIRVVPIGNTDPIPWFVVTGRSATPSSLYIYGTVRYQQCNPYPTNCSP